MSTEFLFRGDSYLNEIDAEVVEVTPEGGIVLDRTIFYAASGGQPGDTGGPPWNPLERVELPTMLALYTINTAWALHHERETGSIEPGKLADLVVLDRNLFTLPPERIHEARVIRTLLDGKTVYQREAP